MIFRSNLFADTLFTATIDASPLTGGRRITASNYPNRVYLLGLFPIDITITDLGYQFQGRSGAANNGASIITNPSTCGAAESKLVATSAQNVSVTKSSSYTVTGCGGTSAPDVTFTSPASGSTATTTASSIQASFSLTGTPTPNCAIGANTVTSPAPVNLSVGSNTIVISCTNSAGADSDTVTVVRNQAPAVSAFASSAGATTTATSTNLTWTATGYPAPTCTINGSPATTGVSEPLTNGANTFALSCSNGIGSPATDSLTVTKNEAPAIGTITSSNGATTTAGTTTLTIPVTAGYPAPTCTVTNTSNSNQTGNPVTLVIGLNHITVSCSNGIGSPATGSIDVTRNAVTAAPAITNLASSATTTTTAATTNITWTTTGTPTPTCTVNGVSASSGYTFTLASGPNTITVVCANGVSPDATASIIVTKNVAPGISGLASSAGATTTAATTNVTWSTTGYPAPTCKVNGTSASSGYTFTLASGPNTITVVCTNGIGSDATSSVSTTKNVAPAVSAFASSAGATTTATSTNLTWTATGYPAPTCTINGSPATTGVSEPLTNGANTFALSCSNGIGSPATDSLTVTKNEAPAIGTITSSNGATTTAGTTTLTIPVTAGYPAPTCTVTNTSNSNQTGNPVTLVLGANHITVSCANGIGSPATGSIDVTRNAVTAAPAISNLASSATTTTTAATTNITWTTTGTPTPTCTVNGVSATSGYTFTLATGPNTITVVCANGVSPDATASIIVTKNVAPGISGLASSAGATTTAATTNVTWSTTGYPAPTCKVNGTSASSGYTFTLASGPNTITVVCTNGVGSDATSSVSTTKNVAPAVSAFASSAGATTTATSTNLSWTATGYPAPTCTINGSPATTGVSEPLTNGANTFALSCSNGVGSPATDSLTVTKNEAPAIGTITSSNGATTTAGTTTLTIPVTAGYPAPTCTVTNTSNSNQTGNPVTLVLGANHITVSCANGIGSPATGSIDVTRNAVTAAPAISNLASSATTTTTAATTNITWTTTGTPTPTCTVNGVSATSGYTFTLATGPNTITVVCTNGVNPDATASIIVTKNVAPGISGLASSAGATTTALSTDISWSATGYPAPTCKLNGVSDVSPSTQGLTPGVASFIVECTNGVAPDASASLLVTRNAAPSIVSFISSSGTTTTATSTNLNWTVTGYPVPTCTINATTASSGVTQPLTNGANTFALSCSNGIGSPATGSLTVTKNEAPAIGTITSSNGATTTAGTTTLTIPVTAGYPAPTCTVTNTSNSNQTGNPVTLVLGANHITVSCANGIGSPATGSIDVTRQALATVPDTTITTYGNPSAGGPAPVLSFQFSGTQSPTNYQCAVAPAPNGAASYTAISDFNSLTWSACTSSSSNTVNTGSLTSANQYMYLVRAVNGAGPDPSPAKGFFWYDTRTFTADPTLQYYTNSLVTTQAATNDAGAHPTLGTTLQVEGSDDGKSVDLVMPDGLMGSLAAIPQANRCSYAQYHDTQSCPSTAKLGTLSGTAIGSVDGSVSASGNLYLIDPDSLGAQLPGAAAAVALIIDNIPTPITPSGTAGKILAIGGLYINDNGFNLRVKIDNIPNQTTVGLRFHATQVSLTLDGDTRPDMGQPASATNPALITNPSQCPLYEDSGIQYGILNDQGADRGNWYQFHGSGTGYYGSTSPEITVDYPVENCDSQPFDPAISFGTDPSPLPASTASTVQDLAITSTVDFNYGDAGLMSTQIFMPPYISTNLPGLGSPDDQCPNSAIVFADNGQLLFDPAGAGGCPDQARVGTAQIVSPLLDGTINADVWLIEASPIPWIGITVSDSTPGNPRGVNVAFIVQTNSTSNEYPTASMLAPFARSACSTRTPSSTNNRRVDTCRTSVTASVSPGAVPDLPITQLVLTIGSVGGRLNSSGDPMPKPLRAATDSDTIACRVGGNGGPNDWLPPTGSVVTSASSAFRMNAETTMAAWGLQSTDELASSIPITGCQQ